MKIEIVKEKLLEALTLTERISGKHLTLSVLNCVLFTVKGSTLILQSTNLDLSIDIEIPVKVITEGIIAIPGAVLLALITNTYSGAIIKLSVKDKNLLVETTSGTALIKTQPHNDFPTLPKVKQTHSIAINTQELLRGIRTVWYSASTATIKPELASIYVYYNPGKLTFVATDSFRLAEKIIPLKKIDSFEPILIPFRNVADIIKVLESADEDVFLNIEENQLSIKLHNIYLTSRLTSGTFPDYKQIIPKNMVTEVIVLKHALINSLKKMNIFSDKFNQINFHIQPSKKIFSLKSQNSDIGEIVDNVSAAVSGDEININFNHKYISDVFQSITTDSISLSFAGHSKPMIIRGVSDTTFLYLVMPMNK